MVAGAKSVISVEIDDKNFNEFNKKIEKYKATLSAMPGQWGAMGKAIQRADKTVSDFATRIITVAKAMNDAKTYTEKFTLGLKAADRTVSSLARGTATMALNIKEATGSLLKWGGMIAGFAGLLAGGGLFGISRLAQSVAERQREARSIGEPIGKTSAAMITYSSMFGGEGGVKSALDKIYEDQHSNSGAHIRALMGSAYDLKQSPDRILQDIIPAIKLKIKSMPPGVWMQSGFLSSDMNMLGMDATKQIYNTPDKEIEQRLLDFQWAEKRLRMGDKDASSAGDFQRHVDVNKEYVSNSFYKSIKPLIPDLDNFSTTFADAIHDLLKSDFAKNFVKKLDENLKLFDKYLKSDDFKEDMNSFFTALDKAAGALWDFAALVSKVSGLAFGGSLTGTQHNQLDILGKSKFFQDKISTSNGLASTERIKDIETAQRHKENDYDVRLGLKDAEYMLTTLTKRKNKGQSTDESAISALKGIIQTLSVAHNQNITVNLNTNGVVEESTRVAHSLVATRALSAVAK